MGSPLYILAFLLLASNVLADNSTLSDTCDLEQLICDLDRGPWSQALEEWATAPAHNERHGRIMALPSSPGYYVTDRVDRPPPPPLPVPRPYSEWPDSSEASSSSSALHRGPGPMPAQPGTHEQMNQAHNSQWSEGSSMGAQHPPAGSFNGQSGAQHMNIMNPQHTQWPEAGPVPNQHAAAPGTFPGQSAQHMNPQHSQWPEGSIPLSQEPQHMQHHQRPEAAIPLSQVPPHMMNHKQSPPPMPLQHASSQWPSSQHPNHHASNTQYEYKDPAGSKIVNRPPNKDKFKPSTEYKPSPYPPKPQPYPVPPGPHRPPVRPAPTRPNPVDRVDDPPKRPVTETDLYLLTAIEKLVYRADLFEKRLRRLEDSVHRLVANKDPAPEPCVTNFTRVGGVCYHFSAEAVDWKEASLYCRRMKASLIELETERERNTVLSAMLTDSKIRGMDVWTGGLNPGLLWIWSHSARPVAAAAATNNTNSSVTIQGDGRCLALVHDPAVNNYVYRGQDCAFRHRFVCEKEEDRARLTNEIDKVARSLELLKGSVRKGRVFDGDDDEVNQ